MRKRDGGSLQTRRWLPPLLAVLLALPPEMYAQQPAAAAVGSVQSLKILPLAGDHAVNDIEHHVMSPLVVQVLDQNLRPVEGAQVVFRFPIQGPGAEFPGGQSSQTARTNADGQASAVGWVANKQLGNFQVHINASMANQLGEAVITMTNANKIVEGVKEKHKSFWSSKWAKISIIAAAAGITAGVVLATRGGGGTTTVTASPGAPTVGGPR